MPKWLDFTSELLHAIADDLTFFTKYPKIYRKHYPKEVVSKEATPLGSVKDATDAVVLTEEEVSKATAEAAGGGSSS